MVDCVLMYVLKQTFFKSATLRNCWRILMIKLKKISITRIEKWNNLVVNPESDIVNVTSRFSNRTLHSHTDIPRQVSTLPTSPQIESSRIQFTSVNLNQIATEPSSHFIAFVIPLSPRASLSLVGRQELEVQLEDQYKMSYSEYKSNSLSLDICDSVSSQTEPERTRLISDPNDLSITPSSSQSPSTSISSKRNQNIQFQVPFLILCLMISLIWFTTTFFEDFSILIYSPQTYFPTNTTNSLVPTNDRTTQWTTLPITKPTQPIHYELIPPKSFNSSSTNQWTILTIHGLGSINGSDAFFLRDHLFNINRGLFNQVKFVIPFAKRLSVDVWGGHPTPAWFNIHDWSDLRSMEDQGHMKENVVQLDRIVKDLKLDMKKTIFMGFSQGAVMSLLLSLNLDRPPAGVLMLSGFLPVPKELPSMILPNRTGISSLYWLHGESDPFFPVSKAQIGYESLKSLGFFKSTGFQSFEGLDHRFDLKEMTSAVLWIEQVMKDSDNH